MTAEDFAVLIEALLVEAVGGWWLHSPPSALGCGDQSDGSRICWMYTRLPTPR
jgi:hypothetical protein